MSQTSSRGNDCSTAPPQRGEAGMLASLLLQDLISNLPSEVLPASKILIKLLRNAASGDPKRGTIRLANPKIQRHVVQVPGALDVLGAAGFAREGEALAFHGAATEAGRCDAQEKAHDGRRALIEALCEGLEGKVAELEPPPTEPVASKPAAEPSSNPSDESSFLSEEDRRIRTRKVQAEKKARKAQRETVKRRWAEDMEEKRAAARRRAKLDDRAKDFRARPDVTIRRKEEKLPLARPFKESDGKRVTGGGDGGGDSRSVRRRLIQECMRGSDSTPEEKQARIRELMRASEGAVLAMADAAASASDAAPKPSVAASLQEIGATETCRGLSKTMDETTAKKPPPGEGRTEPKDRKPAAKSPPEPPRLSPLDSDLLKSRAPNPPSPEWTEFIQRVPRCAGAEGIRDSSVFYARGKASASFDVAVPKCLKRLFKELDGLKESLPSDPECSIWLRFDEETPQFIRALVSASLPGPTPYSGGLFAFDIYVPNDYPRTSPKVRLLTTGGGRVRFGPNLYADGKVCLSLLGTWSGPKWSPQHSSLYQVLISIQGLILGVEHPYYLEPGHGGWEGDVKEGDFRFTGQTLAGQSVQEEVGVPLEVILYEDKLRMGTARYAMVQPLKESLDKRKPGLGAFGEIVRAHFYENRGAILAEVKNWTSDQALGRNRSEALKRIDEMRSLGHKSGAAGTLQIDALRGLLPKLEDLLNKASISHEEVAAESALTASGDGATIETLKPATQPSTQLEDDVKPPAKPQAGISEQRPGIAPAGSSGPASDTDVVEQKRQKMQEAAKSGDFILAGKIQEEVKRLEELLSRIQEAAQQGDFIRAGRLQAQFKALTPSRAVAGTKSLRSKKANTKQQLSDHDEGSDSSDGEMDWGDDGMGPGGLFGPGHGISYSPPGHPGHAKNKRSKHSWGMGHTLTPSLAADLPGKGTAPNYSTQKKAAQKVVPLDQLCRLRIRLPQDKSVVEDFDKNHSLAEVYRRLEQSIAPKRRRESNGNKSAVRGPSVPGGAFSQPLSLAGFTLLLTRPKREFSLEMHGSKSLAELNLAPSATLTVMRCNERGVMYRGEVESRLRSAQGDAMDVEGLTYEGLIELTDRVGKATPKEGDAFLTLTEEEFDANTTKISPSIYLADLANSEEHGEEDLRCPICLGCYDGSDDTSSLRIVNNCGHTMHTGCLQTWLTSSSSCPLCKVPISEGP